MGLLDRPLFFKAALGLTLVAALASVLAPARARAQNDDEDEDEAPSSSQPRPARAPVDARPSSVVPSPPSTPAPALATPRAAVNSREIVPGYLEGRAESTSPSELIHTVERKSYTAAGKGEFTLYPAVIQLNSKFTNTDGIAAGLEYAVQENFAFQLLAIYNYAAGETAFSQQLLELHARSQAADSLSMQYGAVGGFEVAPIYGKFAFYDGTLAQFRFVLNAGAGMGKTQVQLTTGPDTQHPKDPAAEFGDAGFRFLGNLGMGFRILLGERIALRLEVRDLIYTARVDHINGCTSQDITQIGTNGTSTDAGCNAKAFTNSGAAATDLTVAKDLLGDVSSDVLNNLLFFGGISILF